MNQVHTHKRINSGVVPELISEEKETNMLARILARKQPQKQYVLSYCGKAKNMEFWLAALHKGGNITIGEILARK